MYRHEYLSLCCIVWVFLLQLQVQSTHVCFRHCAAIPMHLCLAQRKHSCAFHQLSVRVAVQLGNISVFYKQRSNLFYPVTSYSLPTILLRIPLSTISAMLWTVMTYFVVGFAPDPGRQDGSPFSRSTYAQSTDTLLDNESFHVIVLKRDIQGPLEVQSGVPCDMSCFGEGMSTDVR